MSLNPSSSAHCAGLSFSGKTVFSAAAPGAGSDASNLLTAGRPVQPTAKLLDNWFNGNTTSVNVNNRPNAKVAPITDTKMFRSFVAM